MASVVDIYRALVASHSDAELKGKTIPYTSCNGHMFSFITKEGELALRVDAATREKIAKRGGRPCLQYGREMKDFIVLPAALVNDARSLERCFAASYEHTRALPPKPTSGARTSSKKKAASGSTSKKPAERRPLTPKKATEKAAKAVAKRSTKRAGRTK